MSHKHLLVIGLVARLGVLAGARLVSGGRAHADDVSQAGPRVGPAATSTHSVSAHVLAGAAAANILDEAALDARPLVGQHLRVRGTY